MPAIAPNAARLSQPSAHVQAAALRAAFPAYSVNVIKYPGDKARYEAVRRCGHGPYCLISADAREIWHELRKHSRSTGKP